MNKIARRGFTIVELLVVVVVIAILAAITTVAYQGINTKASDAVQLTSVKQFIDQLEVYKVSNDGYPQAIPSSETTLHAAHSATSAVNNMNFVVKKPTLSAVEQQKLSSFENTYNIKLPNNTLYYSGPYFASWNRQHTFVMSRFKVEENIPLENRSHRAQDGATNNAFPQLMIYSQYCPAGRIAKDHPQSVTGLGNTEMPFLKNNAVDMNYPSMYSSLAPTTGTCSASQTAAFIRDSSTSGALDGTGLFVLKQG